MTPEQFMANFGAIAEAPDGVARLRELVLLLAVRGSLKTQRASDVEAVILREQIHGQREAKIAAKELRRGKSLPPVLPHDVPFDIPPTWLWVRLGELGDWGAGATPSRTQPSYYGGAMPWLKSGELNDGHVSVAEESVTELALTEVSLRRNVPGDVLIAMYGATIGKTAILDVWATTNQAICACTCFEGVDNEYLHIFLKAWRPRFRGQGEGGAQPNISRIKIVRTVFPLPPLAEQKRIVAKVDQLMSMLDELEQRQEKKRSAAIHVSKASLDSLVNAEDPDQLARAWERVSKNFGIVAGADGSPMELRQCIRNLGVRGLLVSARSGGGGASKVLATILASRKELHRAGAAQRVKVVDPVKPLEAPYAVPPNWKWVRVEDLCLYIVDCLHTTPEHLEGGEFPSVRTSEITPGKLLVDQALRVSAETYAERISRLRPEAGDVIYAREGGRFGVAANVPPRTDLCLGQRTMMLRVAKGIDPDYFMWAFNSDTIFDQARATVGGSASPHVNIRAIRRFVFPLPPSREQNKIATKIGDLMALIDMLEKDSARLRQAATKLLSPLLAR